MRAKSLFVVVFIAAGLVAGCGQTESTTTDTAVTDTVAPGDTVQGAGDVSAEPSASEAPAMETEETTDSEGHEGSGAAAN